MPELDYGDRYSRATLISCEQEILSFSGMPKEAFEMSDVIVGEEKYGGATIRTCTIGDPTLPKLVLVHGYGGSLVLWFSNVKELSKKFRLYLLDVPGMGASSRVQYKGAKNK